MCLIRWRNRKNRILIFVILLLAITIFCSGCLRPEENESIDFRDCNVILIVVDALRTDHLGCYGYNRTTSPTIDDLAIDGVLFNRCFSQSSWTVPSMASLFTSKYPTTHGVTHGVIKTSKDSYAVLEQEILGEYHLTLSESLLDGGWYTAGFTTNGHLQKKLGFSQGFAFYDEENCIWRDADCVNERVFSWIEENHGKKFFLWVHYFDLHARYHLPDRLYDPPKPYDMLYRWKGEKKGKEQSIALYDGELAYVDNQIGLLLRKLDELELTRKTIIVLTSDHGESFRDHGQFEDHGSTLYNEEIHIPLLFHFPAGQFRKMTIDNNVRMIDIMPTILNLLHITPPQDIQGVSLVPLFFKEKFSELPVLSETRRWNADLKTYISNHYKFTMNFKNKQAELYDLDEDFYEKNNLLKKKGRMAATIEKELIQYLEKIPKNTAKITIEDNNNRLNELKSLGYLE